MLDIVLRDVAVKDAKALAHILVSANEQAFRGRVPDECLNFTEVESTGNWKRFLMEGVPEEDFMSLATTSDDDVIGYVWGGPNNKDSTYGGELRQLSVLPEFHRQGIGRRLAAHAAQRLFERGITSLRVEVLRVNRNRAFYERIGGTLAYEQLYNWSGFLLPMCVYGWKDTFALRQQVSASSARPESAGEDSLISPVTEEG